MFKKTLLLTLIALFTMMIGVASADHGPAVEVSDQISLDGTVTVNLVVADEPGFIVIHADNGEGSFGAVIGHAPVQAGDNENVRVAIDTSMATSTLYAMLHSDTGEAGVYEFGTVEGADGPVIVDEAPLSPPFAVELIDAGNQLVVDNTVTIDAVVSSVDGFLVIHADDMGNFGPVIGFAPVSAGLNTGVTVELTGEATRVLWPMLHVDTGTAGEYEFGTVEGADGPVVLGETVAVTTFFTGPTLAVPDQVVTDTIIATEVTSDGPGFIVIHADNGEGNPGPVIGFAAVESGTSTDVAIEIDPEGLTNVVFPMLHVDTGEEGVYEFGTVEGADGPVVVDGAPLVFPIDTVPAIVYSGSLDGNMLTVAEAFIDVPGWLAIHADNGEGAPGPVIGAAYLPAGTNFAVTVELDEAGITDTLFPMLHVDTGEARVYEFGTVEGADGPVIVNGAPVVGPLTPQ